jgi:hypothetical protein
VTPYDATPLTDEQVLEHALRAVVRVGSVGSAVLELTGWNASALDHRAADLLERVEAEEHAR